MKIGIISMQRVPNYGSFLQAYGLQKIIENLGHKVVFIDYKAESPVVPFRNKSRLKFKVMDISVIRFLNDSIKYHVLHRKSFVYKYRLQYLKELGIGYKKRYSTPVDVAVIGSDEVFNCLQEGFNVGFSPMLFGQGIDAGKVISYAASFGYTNLEGLEKYNVVSVVADYLRSFNAISVRDDNSAAIVTRLVGIEPELNLDPVLVYDFEIPKIDIPYKDYVILYTYKSRYYSKKDQQEILDFCRVNNKTLISIGNAQKWVKNRVEAAPLALLAYIKAADFIITDTFHGSVFSIKYNKKFAVLIRENNRQKLSDLLCRLHQEDRTIRSFQELQEMYERPADFSVTNNVISKEKEHTLVYLQRNLQ